MLLCRRAEEIVIQADKTQAEFNTTDDTQERLDKGLLDFGIFIEAAHMDKYDYIRLPVTSACL